MSWFRFARDLRKGKNGNGFLKGMFSRWRGRPRRSRIGRGGRLWLRPLGIDPLEDRVLLSVSPADLTAIIVNQTFGAAQTTVTGHSVASDSNGDFVVTWTRTDNVLNSNGNTVTDPTTGNPMTVQDVYGRYFTDEVQRVNLPGPGSYSTLPGGGSEYLPNGIATNFDDDSNTIGSFSLTYNAQTQMQLSITAGTPPSGDPNGSNVATNMKGQFTLGFDPSGVGTTNVANFTLFNVLYDETDPAVAAAEIQNWLRGFTPDSQSLSFSPTGALPITGTFELQVGGVVTAPINFDSTSAATLATTAANMQTALLNAGFAGVIVTPPTSVTTPFKFTVTFPSVEPLVQYVSTNSSPPFAATFASSYVSDTTHVVVNALDPHTFVIDFGAATQGLDQSSLLQVINTPPTIAPATPTTTLYSASAVMSLSGWLPAVQLKTLDRPFTINNIPVSQTDPNQTARAIENYFQQEVTSFSTGVTPFDFPTPERVGDKEAPYVAPVSTNVNTNVVATPDQGFNPTVTVAPVVNADGSLSYTNFDVTFTGVSGAQIEPQMVVTNCFDESGNPIGTTLPGAEGTPIGSTQAQVLILKQSGNEFQVNLPQTYDIYSLTPQPLDSNYSGVAMDASGDFAISWQQAVSQSVAPKDVTNIEVRRYTPVGLINSFSPGTFVPGTVTSDVPGRPSRASACWPIRTWPRCNSSSSIPRPAPMPAAAPIPSWGSSTCKSGTW